MSDTYEGLDLNGLKRLGKEFLDALPNATLEEADAGFKCFSLAYLNADFANDLELNQAAILLQILSKKLIEKEVSCG